MATTTTQPTAPPARRVDYAELGLAALLVVVATLVLYDASQLTTTAAQNGPVGPRAVPFLVGGLLLVTSVLLAVDVLRGGHGEAESGEDIDLEHGADFRSLGLLVVVFLGAALAIPYAGFPIAGAAMFWGTTLVLGSRRWLWDPAIALVVSFGAYLIFTSSLGISLPAGILQGVL